MNYHIAFFASNNYLKESHNKIVMPGHQAVVSDQTTKKFEY
jgi:hypothetical protein